MKLWCEIGKHSWEKTGRGRPPQSCPAHRPANKQIIYNPIPKSAHIEDPYSASTVIEDDDVQALINAGKKLLSTRELYCVAGDHTWQAERKRGKPPRNCPEHSVFGSIERKEELDEEKKKKVQEELQTQITQLSARVGDAEIVDRDAMSKLTAAGGAAEADDRTFKQWLRANSALLGTVEALRARERKLKSIFLN